MMMKAGFVAVDEHMSNLTSPSVGEAASTSIPGASSSTTTSNNSSRNIEVAHLIPSSSSTPAPANISLYSQQQQQQPHLPPPFGGSGSPPPPLPLPQQPKKKRNLPGNPDPDAEVIALSPKTLLATNRFVCEVCNKGFQRDQNLQLHRRGHNLPWKLKQRSNKEAIRKKVYVCPELSCVHHEPSRALGDLTGIKKHFCRKHGEKKWKCDKCSKRYAVRSDWKAHSKICGTREYRCDCGTLFSRRDSFITHRAFCDALAEESTRSTTTLSSLNPLLHHHSTAAAGGPSSATPPPQSPLNLSQFNPLIPTLKTEQADQTQHHYQHFNSLLRPSSNNLPPWLSCPIPPPSSLDQAAAGPGPPSSPHIDLGGGYHHNSSSQLFPSSSLLHHHQNPNPNPNPNPSVPSSSAFHGATVPVASPHMSATALLQKAAQMGVKMNNNNNNITSQFVSSSQQRGAIMRPHHHELPSSEGVTGGLLSSSTRDHEIGNSNGGGGLFMTSGTFMGDQGGGGGVSGGGGQSVFHEVMSSFSSSASGFDGSSFDDAFGGIMMNHNQQDPTAKSSQMVNETGGGALGGSSGGSERDGMTRDFLGLRSFSHKDLLSMAGFDQMSSSYEQQQQQPLRQHNDQNQTAWHG